MRESPPPCIPQGVREAEWLALATGVSCVPPRGSGLTKGIALTRGERCVQLEYSSVFSESRPYEGGSIAYPKPRLLGNAFVVSRQLTALDS